MPGQGRVEGLHPLGEHRARAAQQGGLQGVVAREGSRVAAGGGHALPAAAPFIEEDATAGLAQCAGGLGRGLEIGGGEAFQVGAHHPHGGVRGEAAQEIRAAHVHLVADGDGGPAGRGRQ